MKSDEEEKAVVTKRRPRYIDLILLFVGLAFLLVCFVCNTFLYHIPLAINSASPPKDFCTVSDPIYQAIEANAERWLQELEQTEGYPRIIFIEINGRNYGVRLTGSEETQIFYITTEGRWPGTAEYGNNGYFYSPERDPSFVFGKRLIGKQLSENVYCYWWNYDV